MNAIPRVARGFGEPHDAAPATANASDAMAAQAPSATKNTSLTGTLWPARLIERLAALPVECYPIAFILVFAIVLLLRPSKKQVAAARAARDGAPAPGAGHDAVQPRGKSAFGAFVATVGLAIIAVAVTAIARAHFAAESGFFRRGVILAALGQALVLVGLIAMGLASRRRVRSGRTTDLELLDREFARLRLASSVGASANAGQIAQIKAQLACLAEQVDHLGPASSAAGPIGCEGNRGTGVAG